MTGFLFGTGAASGSILATGSTTPRSPEDRASEVKNILDYGAIEGDSSANAAANTLAIQAAVYAAFVEGSGRVRIPPGTFWVGQSTNTAAYPSAISLGAFYGVYAVAHPYTWWDDFTFSIKHVVSTATGLFKSVQNSNLNHNPETDLTDTWWTPVTGPNVPYGTCSVIIEGSGYRSHVKGNFAGFIFDRADHNGSPMHIVIKSLRVTNLSQTFGAGCIRLMGVDGAEVANCDIQGLVGVQIAGNPNGILMPDGTADTSPEETASTSFISSVHNCTIIGLTNGTLANSVGVMMSMHIAVYQCSIVLFQHAIRGYGVGSSINANRIENNDVGILLGMDAVGSVYTAQGYTVTSNSFESNRDAIYLWSCQTTTLLSNTSQHAGGAAFPINRSGLRIYEANSATVISCHFGEQTGGPLSKGAIWFEGANGGGLTTFINTHCSSFLDENTTHDNYKNKCRHINCTGAFPQRTKRVANLPNGAIDYPYIGDKWIVTDGQRSSGPGSGTTAVLGSIVTGTGTTGQTLEVMWNGAAWQCTIVI